MENYLFNYCAFIFMFYIFFIYYKVRLYFYQNIFHKKYINLIIWIKLDHETRTVIEANLKLVLIVELKKKSIKFISK